jgi:hypothetical protein
MKPDWTRERPLEPGWYFFKSDAYAEQLAWIYFSSGKWLAMVRHNTPLFIDEFANAEFNGPLTGPDQLVNDETAGNFETVLAQLGLVGSELQ